jgi:hypothetical protein
MNTWQIQWRARRTPLQILGSLAWWVRADRNVTQSGGVVDAWGDLSGNGVNFTGTLTARPAFVSNSINGRPSILGDGTNDRLAASWSRVAPGTQPFYVWTVAKAVTWTLNDAIMGDSVASDGFLITQRVATPGVSQYNGTVVNNNSGLTLGAFKRIETQFTNSVAGYIKIGSTNVTGANANNQAGGGTMGLFSGGNAASFFNGNIAEAFAFLGTPTTAQRSELNYYCSWMYGGGLT